MTDLLPMEGNGLEYFAFGSGHAFRFAHHDQDFEVTIQVNDRRTFDRIPVEQVQHVPAREDQDSFMSFRAKVMECGGLKVKFTIYDHLYREA